MKDRYDISLMDIKLIEYMKDKDGLCFKKFHADLITDDIDYSKLKENDIVSTQGKRIKITKVGKRCFPECTLKEKPCLLSSNVAFGEEI